MRVFLYISFLLTIAGCAYDADVLSGGMSEGEWCAADEGLPWSGCWREIRQINCETGEEFETDQKIGELRLKSDDGYSITWHPFETYTDYAGSYQVNEARRKITFDHDGRSGFDGIGTFQIRQNGDLELVDIWFGTFYTDSEQATLPGSCGYVFRRK